MKPLKFVILCSVLTVAGCGDSDDTDTATKADKPMLEQAASKTSEAMNDAAETVKEEASAAADQATDMAEEAATAAGDVAESGKQMASEAMDDAKDTLTTTGETVVEKADEAAAAASAAVGVTPAVDVDMPAGIDLKLGKSVYDSNCQVCHATGLSGAPKLGDTANWTPRIAQGMDTLFRHAIEGFTGSAGMMPPKGGFANLSDDEVKAAVGYMVSQAR